MYDSEDFDTDGLDFEDDFEDDEADQLALGALVGAGLGAGAGGWLGTGLYDGTSWALNKAGAERASKWMDDSPNLRSFLGNAGAGIGGTIGAALGAASPTPESDPIEPEYETDSIDAMEVLLEEALEADGEDASMAVDEMVGRAFGMMRAAPQIRRLMMAVATRARQLIAQARRDPRLRSAARAIPVALRRTAVILLNRIARQQPVSPEIALRVFAGVLSGILKNGQQRSQVSHTSAMRARRYRAQRGLPPPRSRMPAQRPKRRRVPYGTN